ncbi:class F sortase [Rugosimonospora africana]|uniref:Class F sortase n=1 Tax=Rugosimonospora africana TaxID=556532 RepID=A0A8J3VS96_9ACTN|nr:class F sortase [Rugosimonospora africana]GIH16228.1 class F sortase [Rugosimonospora africana]
MRFRRPKPLDATLILAGSASLVAGLALAFASPGPLHNSSLVPTTRNHARPAPSASGTHPEPPTGLELPVDPRPVPVVPVAVDPGGGLTVPDSPGTVGWWAGGAMPGGTDGTVILASHVDTAGPAALFRVSALGPGALVYLDASTNRFPYQVTSRRSYPGTGLPAEVFDQSVPARLVLITCTGRLHDGHYDGNVVVYARPQPVRAPMSGTPPAVGPS